MRPRRLISGGALTFVFTGLLLFGIPATSSAYQEIRGDLGHADPCTQAGVGDAGGAAYRHYRDPSDSDRVVTVTLMCSPKKGFPSFTFAKLVNDWVGHQTFSGIGGGIASPGVNPSYLHGDIAEALRYSDFKASREIVDALVGAGVGLTTSLAGSLIMCAAGGIPSLGITCAAAAGIVGGAVVATLLGAAGAVAKDFITSQFNRYSAAANAKWFVWMEKWGMFWNSVAGVSDTGLNPSLSNSRIGSEAKARVGVQFTSAPAGGGPDFFDIKPNGTLTAEARAELAAGKRSAAASKAEIGDQLDSLNFNHGAFGIDPGGAHRVRTGTADSDDVLRGGRGDDTLQGVGGSNVLRGRAGVDTILAGTGDDRAFGGRGNDYVHGNRGGNRLAGGRGHDTVVGGGGRNILNGGPGSDTVVDWGRRTIARTGTVRRELRDYVNVRDGRANDVVHCETRRTTVIADRGDRLRGSCGKVIRRGPVFKPGR